MNNDIAGLKNKVAKLERRVRKLEDALGHNDKDVIFDDVVKVVQDYEAVSASLLQRKFSVGYARAARLLDQLEEKGIVGSGAGSKPRKVFKIPHRPGWRGLGAVLVT